MVPVYAVSDRAAVAPRGPRPAWMLAAFGLTVLLHVAVLAGLLRAGPPPPPAAPGVVGVRLLPAPAPATPGASSAPHPRRETGPRVRAPSAPAHAPDAMPTPPPEAPALPAPAATVATVPAAVTHEEAAADTDREAEAYAQVLWARIAAARPQGLHLPGEAWVGFTLDADGRLTDLRLLRPSGNGLLDRLALRTVRRAAPYPPPPPAAGREFRIAFHFR